MPRIGGDIHESILRNSINFLSRDRFSGINLNARSPDGMLFGVNKRKIAFEVLVGGNLDEREGREMVELWQVWCGFDGMMIVTCNRRGYLGQFIRNPAKSEERALDELNAYLLQCDSIWPLRG
jgi:hypothetical protein